MDKRIKKANDIDTARPGGWIVDLSPVDRVDPDCWWYFRTRQECKDFLARLADGIRPDIAAWLVSSL